MSLSAEIFPMGAVNMPTRYGFGRLERPTGTLGIGFVRIVQK